jgi:hypothetical protein
MIFSDAPEFSTTFLKISKAKEFSDSISETWSAVRFIGTGSTGKISSGSLLHDKNINGTVTENTTAVLKILFFIILSFDGQMKLN